MASAVCTHAVRNRPRVSCSRWTRARRRRRWSRVAPHHSSMSETKHDIILTVTSLTGEQYVAAERDVTHPDLVRGFPSVLQSWSNGCRCLRQKFRWHWSQVTRIISFCLQPPLEHLLVKIWKTNVACYSLVLNWRWGKKGLLLVLTFLFLCAGSDLQSLSMCSPTLMSGISPLLMGMGVLHRGHTGTWISYWKNSTKHTHPWRVFLHHISFHTV